MNFSKSFSYMFEDPEWFSKLGIGALVAVVPILNFAWLGYCVAIVRRVRQGNPRPLPEWNSNFGQYFVDGLILTVANFVYTLPMTIIACLAITPTLLPLLAQDNIDLQGWLAAAGALGFFAIMCVVVFYGLVYSFLSPAITIHFAENGTFGSVFRLGGIVRVIRRDFNTYLIAWLVSLGAAFLTATIAGFVGGVVGWLPVIGWVLVTLLGAASGAWAGSVSHYAFGLVSLRTSAPPIDQNTVV